MLHDDLAFKCFQENLRLFANSQTQPEKYNLYQGLASLAEMMKKMQTELRYLRQEVQTLKNCP